VDAVSRLAPELGPVHEALAYSGVAITSLGVGDIADAAAAAEGARRRLTGLPVTAAVSIACPSAEIRLAQGDVTTARQLADAAVLRTPGCFRTRELTTRARVAIAQGDLGQADRDLHAALAFAAGGRTILDAPSSLECLADLERRKGDHRDAARLLGAAAGIRQRIGIVRFNVHQGRYDECVAAIREALDDSEFESAWAGGMALSTDEAIAYVQRGHGERKRPASGWASLTPAELQVVSLVQEGLGNKDIATRLFVSPRTVQTHLTHIFNKLGITSRLQLAQEAARHD
jgi:ATP/maltotriose-dependent transcriptional regulator MalT